MNDKAFIHKFSHTDKVRPDGVVHLRVLFGAVIVQILTSTCCISLQPWRLCANDLRIDQTSPGSNIYTSTSKANPLQ